MPNLESRQAYNSTRYIATDQQRIVLEALQSHPLGLTREEICNVTALKLQSCTARCHELLDSGAIVLKDLPGDSDYYE